MSSNTEKYKILQEIFIISNFSSSSANLKIFIPINYLKNASTIYDNNNNIEIIEICINKILSISKIS